MLVVFRVTRKTGKKTKPGPFLGFFRITQNRNRIQNSFRITQIRKKNGILFFGLPESEKKPEYFFSDYPNPEKNRNPSQNKPGKKTKPNSDQNPDPKTGKNPNPEKIQIRKKNETETETKLLP